MIIIEPQSITDNLTTISIPEPDTGAGEVEWLTGTGYTTPSPLLVVGKMCHNGTDFICIDNGTGDQVYNLGSDCTTSTLEFDASGEVTTAEGICFGYNNYYISEGGTVYEYNSSGVATGGEITLAHTSSGENPLAFDGVYICALEIDATGRYYIRRYAFSAFYVDGFPVDRTSFENVDMHFYDGIFYILNNDSFTVDKYSSDGEYLGSFNYDETGFVLPADVRGIAGDVSQLRLADGNAVSNDIHYFSFDGTYGKSYAVGDEVILSSTHKKYTCAVANNTSPDIGVTETPPSWVISGSTNKWAMFDFSVGSGSVVDSADAPIVLTFDDPNMDSLCIFNHDAATIEVDIAGGTVASNEVFNVDGDRNFSLYDIDTGGGTVTVEIDNSAASVSVGELVIGNKETYAATNYGSSYKLKNYSRVETDDFGNIDINIRRNVKSINYNITIDSDLDDPFYYRISDLINTPIVYSGSTLNNKTLAFGYAAGLDIFLTSGSVSKGSMTVTGVV